MCIGGCGGGGSRRHASAPLRRAPTGAPAPAEQRGPALGLTEDNADLLWNARSSLRTGGEAFQPARLLLTALHPRYVRLLIDWAALQPQAGTAAAMAATVDGCARASGPCGAYAGVQAQLAAIASQQRADPGAFRVVVDILGTPAWAAQPPSGCAPPATAAARAPRRQALAAYRALIASLLALARSEGVALEWWSPWNEPNNPSFLSPQRAACSAAAPSLAPALYTMLARAMAGELAASPGRHRLLIGELQDVPADSPDSTSVASFIAALPSDVVCLAGAFSIHDYALQSRRPGAGPGAVSALEQALDARGGCASSVPIWVTEAGAGAPHPGRPRPPGAGDELAGCLALALQLRRWDADPRVGAVFQYSFREDPAYPVGLLSADLARVYPAYRLWLQYAGAQAAGLPPPPPALGCA